MARMCDTPDCKSTDDVQKIVFMVVSGESCQCHGDFCKACRDLLPGKLKGLGMKVQSDKPLRQTPPPKEPNKEPNKEPAANTGEPDKTPPSKPDSKPDKK